MSTPEGHVKDMVKKLLKKHIDSGQVYVHWPVQTGYGAPTLDCVGTCRGKSFAIETKAPGKSLTPRQELTRSQMEAAGVAVFIVGEEKYTPYEGGQHYPYSGMTELEAWLLLR